MNKIIEWFTRKKLIIVSILSLILLFLIEVDNVTHFLCKLKNYKCYDLFDFIFLILLFFVLLSIPILLTFIFKNKDIFDFWKKTLFIYFFIYLFFIILVPWNWGDVYLPIYKGTVALALNILFLIFSIIFIVYKSFKK